MEGTTGPKREPRPGLADRERRSGKRTRVATPATSRAGGSSAIVGRFASVSFPVHPAGAARKEAFVLEADSARQEGAAVSQDQRATDVPNKGLECSNCGCRHFWTKDKRNEDGYIRRRRECRNCGKRVTTTERIVGAK
jgi:hypothetical protein